LLRAYAMGVFPMAASREAEELRWIDPARRTILPLDGFHLSRSLARSIRRNRPRVTTDTAFAEVVTACADRPETWINAEIFAAYTALHAQGHAHSVEVWAGEHLVGGVYGVTLGTAFFGESMFSRATDASKTALAYLIHRLRAGGFTLFDTQFMTDHLASLGAQELTRAAYQRRLQAALITPASWTPPQYPTDPQPEDVLPSFAP
jgi:leucyl/phenylalanyl-tRNA---protein transferase